MRRIIGALASAGALATVSSILTASPALAHADRSVGPVDMAIGFGTEPAYAGQPNSAQVILFENGKPVVDLGDSLKMEVSFGGEQTTIPLEPDFEIGEFGEPGDYRGWFIPSQAGKYTFHLSGSVHGTKIDLSVTSGPKTFSEVTSPTEAMFPAVDTPSNQELSQRIEQDSARLTAAAADTASAKSAADDAKTVAVIAVIVGGLGIIVAIWALVRGRRTTR
jgi:hypothetical protein